MAFGLLYDFLMGQSINAYEYFGAHFTKFNNKDGVIFRVYAPMARSVSVIGTFNSWQRNRGMMNKVDDSGVFELFVEAVNNYDEYKYSIEGADGVIRDKQDPFAFLSEFRPQT